MPFAEELNDCSQCIRICQVARPEYKPNSIIHQDASPILYQLRPARGCASFQVYYIYIFTNHQESFSVSTVSVIHTRENGKY